MTHSFFLFAFIAKKKNLTWAIISQSLKSIEQPVFKKKKNSPEQRDVFELHNQGTKGKLLKNKMEIPINAKGKINGHLHGTTGISSPANVLILTQGENK